MSLEAVDEVDPEQGPLYCSRVGYNLMFMKVESTLAKTLGKLTSVGSRETTSVAAEAIKVSEAGSIECTAVAAEVKFVFYKKATKIDETFTVDLTFTT